MTYDYADIKLKIIEVFEEDTNHNKNYLHGQFFRNEELITAVCKVLAEELQKIHDKLPKQVKKKKR